MKYWVNVDEMSRLREVVLTGVDEDEEENEEGMNASNVGRGAKGYTAFVEHLAKNKEASGILVSV